MAHQWQIAKQDDGTRQFVPLDDGNELEVHTSAGKDTNMVFRACYCDKDGGHLPLGEAVTRTDAMEIAQNFGIIMGWLSEAA